MDAQPVEGGVVWKSATRGKQGERTDLGDNVTEVRQVEGGVVWKSANSGELQARHLSKFER
jgi:hypothetical protein